VILCGSAGEIQNLGEQAGDTGKQADTGRCMTWGGGVICICAADGGVWGGNPPR